LGTNEIQFFNYIIFVLSTCQNSPSSVQEQLQSFLDLLGSNITCWGANMKVTP